MNLLVAVTDEEIRAHFSEMRQIDQSYFTSTKNSSYKSNNSSRLTSRCQREDVFFFLEEK